MTTVRESVPHMRNHTGNYKTFCSMASYQHLFLVSPRVPSVLGVPGVCLKLKGKSSVLLERLPSERVTADPYCPLRIGNSRKVLAILIGHRHSLLISYRAHWSPSGQRYPSVPSRPEDGPTGRLGTLLFPPISRLGLALRAGFF